MSLTIKTAVLQEAVTKAIKGVSNNKFLPITGLLGIKCSNDKLVLTTTDATNYLYVMSDLTKSEDFAVTVYADTFSKLISRMTCENVTLTLTENYLEVTGNGTYKIELPLDETGNIIKYPDPLSKVIDLTSTEMGTIELGTVKQIINSVKPSLSVTTDVPCYMNYYMKDKVVGTDTYKIACLDTAVFEKEKLISSELLLLVSVMDSAEIKYEMYDGGIIVFTSPNVIVYGKVADGLNEYSITAIENLIDLESDSSCTVSKDKLLQLLDRLSLFVNPYDKNAIRLTFGGNAVTIDSLSSSGSESISYLSADNAVDYDCLVDIQMFIEQIKAVTGNTVTIFYGHKQALKLQTDNLIQIIALLDDLQ